MEAQALVRKSLKLVAALSAALLTIVSVAAIFSAQSMGADPFREVRWRIALAVLPIIAIGSFIRGTLLDQRSLKASVSYYLLAICMALAWFLLTRG